ncbi:hypothetical protein ABPG72_000904 [Tetrahymena utriculariae]
MSTNNAAKHLLGQELAQSSDRKSFFTLFHSPSSTGYSGATTAVNWMKQKFTFPSDRIQNIDIESMAEQNIDIESMAEHQIECSPTAQFQSSLCDFKNSQLQRAHSFREDLKTQNQVNVKKRPTTREEEYKLYPALKYRDYASKNTYIKYTNYRTSSISNLNKEQKELLDFQLKSANNHQLNLDNFLEVHNQMEMHPDHNAQKISKKSHNGIIKIFKNEQTVFSTEKKQKSIKSKRKQSKSQKNKQNTLNRSNSTNCFTLDVQKPYFIASRAQINRQQRQFQTDQVSFIPDPQNSEIGFQTQQMHVQNDIKSQQNKNQKQKFFISRTRFRNTDEKLIRTDKTSASQSQNIFDYKQGVYQTTQNNKNYNTSKSEQILTDVDIRLMMISAGIDPLKDYLSRRANFGCKSIYNPDLLNHFERINSKNRYYSQLIPPSENGKKYQTQKDVEEYYHHLEKFDKVGNDEYFIQTRNNATNYNRFHMSKPNIRMRYEQQLKIANYLITKAQQEKQNNQQKLISAPLIEQIISDSENDVKLIAENNLVHGLHKYLLAKDLIKETWKQLQQPQTPNPNKSVQMLNNNTVSSQSFTALIKDKNFINNQVSAKSSQPVSMKSISIDDNKVNQQKQFENLSNQQEKLESQFKFQQFIIDQGLQEMNHYNEIVRWYKERFTELNQKGKEGRNNQNIEKQTSAQKSKSKSRSQSPNNLNVELKDCNLNSQQQNLPTELNVYTREDIFIKKTIDKMINSDEIDIVSLSDIAQLQKIIQQRQTILEDLKHIIIKSVNEILVAKLKKTKKNKKSNSQEFSEQFIKQNSTIDTRSKQELYRSYSSQKLSNQSKNVRLSVTQQTERNKKYTQQNSLGYQDYVQQKMEKEFFSKLKKKTKKGEASTFITDHHPQQQEDTKKSLQNKNELKESLKQNNQEVIDDLDCKQEKQNKIDLKQLKTRTLQNQESMTPMQKNTTLSQSTPLNRQGFKNINKILDEQSQDTFFEIDQKEKEENQNNEKQEQQESVSLTKIKNQLLVLTNNKQQQFIAHSVEEDQSQQIQITKSIQSEPKQSQKSQQSNTQNDSISAINSINSIKDAEDQIVYDESPEKNISLSQVSDKSLQSDVLIPSFSIFRQESPIKQQEPVNTIISLSQQKKRFKNSYDYIQPLIEDLDENESPINQQIKGLKRDQTFEIQLAQQNSQSPQKSQCMLNEERTSLSKFNPIYAQKESITDLQQSDEQSKQGKKNINPSIMISDSLAQIRNSSIIDDGFKINQEDKLSDYSSLSQIEVKKNREVKQTQQILMDALKQADIRQSRVNTPSLLELPKSKNFITLSANKDSQQQNTQRSNLSSRSNLDSPQLSAVLDTQRSIQSKTEYEKEKLNQLMEQQQRLNKKKAIKSSQRMHSDSSKVLNLQQTKLAMAQQFNAQQEFNHLETQSINTRNEKITGFFEMADKIIATKATLNKPGGYNPFFNEEQAEQVVGKLNKSRNKIDSSENELINNLKERVATLEDEKTNLKNLLNDKESREQAQLGFEQNQTGNNGNQSNINNEVEINSNEEKDNQNEAVQNVKQQVRFDVQNENDSGEQDQKQKNKKSEQDQSQLYSGDLNIGLEQESSVFSGDLKSQTQIISLTGLQSQTNLKDESKKKFLQKKNSINTNNNKQKSRPTLVKTNTQNDLKIKDGQILRQSNSIITTLPQQKSINQLYQHQPSLSYLDENPTINKIISQHNLSDIQKLVDQKFQHKKSMAQGFSAASLFQIMSESFIELEEQANIMKEQDSNIFSFKKSVSNLKSSQRLIKARSFRNQSQKGGLKQSAINEILNEYKINDKMSLIEKRRVIQKLVDKLEQRADIEEDQNFNLILYKQVKQEMQFMNQRESCEIEYILEQKPNLQQDLSLLDQVDKNKRDFMRGKLKFSDNLILNQKNNILQEVNEEDLEIDNEFMDVIQRLVKQNEDLDEETLRKKIFQDQTILIQRSIKNNQKLAPVIEDFKQIALQQSQINQIQKKKKNLQNNVQTFTRQPTKYYSPSKKMSKQEYEIYNKMQKLQEKFQKALKSMSNEEKKELKNVYLNIKFRAESR